jgi:hypothetical protein
MLENETESKNTLNNKLVDVELESDIIQACQSLPEATAVCDPAVLLLPG